MRRDDDDLGELLENLDIEAYLDSQGVDYTRTRGRSGPQLNVKVCPVCGNSASKVFINADTGLGNCFAGSHPAGETFSKWKFVRACVPDVPGRQVVDHIRSWVSSRGWTPKRKSVVVQEPVQLVIPDSYPLPLADGRSIKYLTNRGISPQIAAYFHLRYCHNGWFNYTLDGQKKGMFFGERVLIPVYDLDGNMVTFQGRDIVGNKDRKYLFPPGLASTGSHLLNGYNVKDTKRVAVGEGAFDVMALKIAFDEDPGLRDVVPIGTFGKHLSYGTGDSQEAKLMVLKDRGVEELTWLWDGEVQATDDAIEAGLRARSMGFRVRLGMLPAFKDPNEVPAAVVRKTFYEAVTLTPQSAVTSRLLRRRMNAV